jgi:nucleoid-associated protein
MILSRSIIHELVKEKKQKDIPQAAPSFNEGQLLDVESLPVTSLIDSIVKIYGTKGNSSAQGTFDLAGGFAFPHHLNKFIAGEDDFLDFTKKAMQCLLNACRDINFATGGYIAFGHYISEVADNSDMLLIAMVKKRDGITLNNLVPETIQEVDLSKLHQAVRINISSYKEWVLENEKADGAINPVNSYLSFVSPRNNKDASGYFVDAIGCTNAVLDKVATSKVISAVNDFFESKQALKTFKREAKETIASKLYDISKSDNPECAIETIDSWVTAFIPDELQDEMSGEFCTLANNDPYNVPALFKPNSTAALNAMKLKLNAKDFGWSLNIERTILGDSDTALIEFDKENKRLIINELPQDIMDSIKEALN